MRIGQVMMTIGLAAALAAPAFGQDSVAMAAADQLGGASLAIISWKMDEGAGRRSFSSMAVCVAIDSEGRATLMGLGMNASAQPEEFLDLEVTLPGVKGKTFKATLQGIDSLSATSLAFVRIEGDHGLQAVEFARESNLAIGDEVVSVGLLPENLGRNTYVGKAYVSTSVRTPDTVFVVTGGKLTGVGSVVLDGEGKVVGMVSQQMWSPLQMIIQNQAVNVPTRGQQWTDSFLPVEDFADVFDRIPATPADVKPIAWMGVLGAETVEENLWIGYGLTTMGVRLYDVIPGYAADNAGLVEGDIIVAVNGQPLEELATADLTAGQMVRDITRVGVGAEVQLNYVREAEEHSTVMTLTAWPTRPDQAPRFIDMDTGLRLREKVELDEYIDNTPAAKIRGIIVLDVAKNRAGDSAGLKIGDVITAIAGQPVKTIEVYKKLMDEQRASSTTNSVVFLIRRGDQDKAINIRFD